jgi:hypothetical protein
MGLIGKLSGAIAIPLILLAGGTYGANRMVNSVEISKNSRAIRQAEGFFGARYFSRTSSIDFAVVNIGPFGVLGESYTIVDTDKDGDMDEYTIKSGGLSGSKIEVDKESFQRFPEETAKAERLFRETKEKFKDFLESNQEDLEKKAR